MKIVLFYHSGYSDWNHGNAHFLRGTIKALQGRGHEVILYEPESGWSLQNLLKEHGAEKMDEFRSYYPTIVPQFYNCSKPLNAERIFKDADVVIVHEWNTHELISVVGEYKKQYGFKLIFHDTHHRAVSEPKSMAAYDFSNYDGALVFGQVLKDLYLKNNWFKQVWSWHEAADANLFKPYRNEPKQGDLVWIGNWGDEERAEELMEFLINPVAELGLKAKIYGVRYPKRVIKLLKESGIEYGGYLPNYRVPEIFSQYRFTVHVPRRPYVKMLPGIPTIRPFEAMSCGIPMISSPWNDAENLFSVNDDFLMVKNGKEMKEKMTEILDNTELANSLSENGRKVILEKHTCEHRADELESFINSIQKPETQKITVL